MKKFRIWLEQRNEFVVRDAIVSKIRSDLGVGDEDEIIDMKTKELSDEMQRELLKLGPVMDVVDSGQTEDIITFMKKGDTTVGLLIQRVIGGKPAETPPEAQPPESNPATRPQQSQNFPTGAGWA